MNAMAAMLERKALVLIAADHVATRVGVRLALREDVDCVEAADEEDAVAVAARDRPDVCVLDFSPTKKGIRVAARIAAKLPEAAIVLMSRRLDADECLAAVRAGVAGYLPETIDPNRLPFVVRGLLRGEAAIPRHLVGRLIDELRGRDRRPQLELLERRRVELTAREWDVVQRLRQGMSTKEIARSLEISEVTVRRHISGVDQKLGVASRADLLRLLETAEPVAAVR